MTAAAQVFNTSAEIPVKVIVRDPDVFTRVTGPGGDEWRGGHYNLHTEADVLEYLAFSCVYGIGRVNQLHGWADLADDAATMEVVSEPR